MIFGPSRAPKPRISLDRVDVFKVFTISSSRSLFALSSGLLRPIFGSSGHLLASSRAYFSWPKMETEKDAAPLFDVHVPKFASDLPNGAPGALGVPRTTPKRPQIHPKMRPKGPKFRVPRVTS